MRFAECRVYWVQCYQQQTKCLRFTLPLFPFSSLSYCTAIRSLCCEFKIWFAISLYVFWVIFINSFFFFFFFFWTNVFIAASNAMLERGIVCANIFKMKNGEHILNKGILNFFFLFFCPGREQKRKRRKHSSKSVGQIITKIKEEKKYISSDVRHMFNVQQ